MNQKIFHSVTLNLDKCKGCTTCMKVCPTEAIRVRDGKARIINERCIDCGQCIKVCPHRAKAAVCDGFDELAKYEHTIALPAPSLYGQFNNLDDVGYVLTGLTKIGFDEVFEVAGAAELISDVTTQEFEEALKMPKPAISSACPACVRLIKNRFPQLIGNIISHAAPVELAAIIARNRAVERTGLSPEKIGVFFISPCPAKVTAAHMPMGMGAPTTNGAIAISDAYKRLLPVMNKLKPEEITVSSSGAKGVGWAVTGGESDSIPGRHFLAVDGIENVVQILEDLEDDKLPDLELIELNACTQGCVGGCLNMENPYVAKTRLMRLMQKMPYSKNKASQVEGIREGVDWGKKLEYTPSWKLDDDMNAAMEKMSRIRELEKSLPGLNCGSCGAPSCKALAEDVILGFGNEEDCIFRAKGGEGNQYLPRPFREPKKEN